MLQLIRTRPKTSIAVATLGLATASPWLFPDSTIVRTTRAGYVLGATTIDYKYTWWKHPQTDPNFAQHSSACHIRAANRFLNLCTSNKGLYIKVGQYLSSMNHALPNEFTGILKVLQDAAPFHEFSMVERVFQEDFGHSTSYFFKEVDTKPLASASLAQVHRAVTHDGREVALKVQYPTLKGQFNGDMFMHWLTLRSLTFFFPQWNISWMHDEIEVNLRKELDFLNEGKNCERCTRHFAGNPRVIAPKIYWDITSSRVLSMEFIHGIKIDRVEQLKKQNISAKSVAYETVKAFAEQIYVHGFVHCDPHPGNILIRPGRTPEDFQVVLLDHGLYRELPEATRLNYCNLWRALILTDDKEVERYSTALGAKHWRLFAMVVLMRPYGTSSGPGFERPSTKEDWEKLRAHTREQLGEMMESMPRELLLVLRNQNYMRSLCKDLGNPVNRFKIMARSALEGTFVVTNNDGVGESGTKVVRSIGEPSLIPRFKFEFALAWQEWRWTLLKYFAWVYLTIWNPPEQTVGPMGTSSIGPSSVELEQKKEVLKELSA